jgi:transcription elongation GreA/GreB family factor
VRDEQWRMSFPTRKIAHAVTIARDDGREETFRIVGEDEADPTR